MVNDFILISCNNSRTWGRERERAPSVIEMNITNTVFLPRLLQGVAKLFEEFDQNKNSALEIKELAQMNLKLFFTVPRFGIVGKYSHCGDVKRSRVV